MALQDIVKKNSTSRSVPIYVFDNTTGLAKADLTYASTGIALWYRREGATVTQITEVTLATTNTAWASGGFIALADGEYRLDLPDAAFATGANYVDYGGTFTGFQVVGGRVRLIDVDLEDTVRGGLTALPNAAAAGSNGLIINGSNTGAVTLNGLTTGALATSTITTTGNFAISGTMSTGGTTTFNALTVTNNTLFSGTTTHTGAVSHAGTTTLASMTVTGALTAGSAPLGVITGSLSGAVGSVSSGVNTIQLAGQTVVAGGAVTFPSTVASTTNLTGGTITTVTNLTNAPTVGDLTTAMKTAVKLQITDALNVDTYAEPAQGAPTATTTLRDKIGWLYKAWRNKATQTASQYSLYNDDAATVDAKAAVSDDGTTLTKGEVATGP